MIDVEKELNLEYDRAINIESDFHRNQAIDRVLRKARKLGVDIDTRRIPYNEVVARLRKLNGE